MTPSAAPPMSDETAANANSDAEGREVDWILPPLPSAEPTAAPRVGRAWLTGFALLFYVLGAATGLGVAVLWYRSLRSAPPSGEAIAAQINARLERDYHLDPKDAAAVKEAVSRSLAVIEDKRQAFNKETQDELQRLREQVETVLGPEKAKSWDTQMEGHFGRHRVHGEGEKSHGERGSHH